MKKNFMDKLGTFKDLKLLKKIYIKLLNDPYHELFTDNDLKKLIVMTDERVLELKKEIENQELDTQEGRLLKLNFGGYSDEKH